jgi:hypothetical protein
MYLEVWNNITKENFAKSSYGWLTKPEELGENDD